MELPPAPVPPNVVVGDRPRRAVDYDDSEPDDDEEEDLELGPPDADDGWD